MQVWNVNGRTIEFEEESHTYHVDGKKCISVTQLLHFYFPNMYKNVNEEILKRKAELGTELHNAIEIYEQDGWARDDLEEFRNYKFLKSKFKFNVVRSEVPILIDYKHLTICGRLDQVQELDGVKGLADIKHTATLNKEYVTMQLNLYRIGYQQTYKDEIQFLKAIHLNKDKRKYVDIDINEEYAKKVIEEYAVFCD